VSEAARGSAEIAENITAVATAAESTSQGSGNTLQAAQELTRMASELQSLMSQFTTEEQETGSAVPAVLGKQTQPAAPARLNGKDERHHTNGKPRVLARA
jgi:hypothetical protein